MKYLLFLIVGSFSLLSAEPVCKKCEAIREYNKEHPGDYEYYDDYLKATKKESEKVTDKPASR